MLVLSFICRWACDSNVVDLHHPRYLQCLRVERSDEECLDNLFKFVEKRVSQVCPEYVVVHCGSPPIFGFSHPHLPSGWVPLHSQCSDLSGKIGVYESVANQCEVVMDREPGNLVCSLFPPPFSHYSQCETPGFTVRCSPILSFSPNLMQAALLLEAFCLDSAGNETLVNSQEVVYSFSEGFFVRACGLSISVLPSFSLWGAEGIHNARIARPHRRRRKLYRGSNFCWTHGESSLNMRLTARLYE